MPRRLRRILTSAATALALVGPGAVSAAAINGGTPDGGLHPNVAIIAAYTPLGRARCSATLVSRTLLLTAAHCLVGTIGKIAVSFDPNAGPPLGPAANADAGYTGAELAAYGWMSGDGFADPAFTGQIDTENLNDVGVVRLDTEIGSPVPAVIAPPDYLTVNYRHPKLNKALFTAVGFGVELGKDPRGSGRLVPVAGPIIRRFAQMPGQKLTTQVLMTNGNAKDARGTGGTCFGDSGGPVLIDNYVVAVISYTKDNTCGHLEGQQRVDVQVIQDWLATYGVTFG